MSSAQLPIAGFIGEHQNGLTALLTTALTLIALLALRHTLSKRGQLVAEAIMRGELTAVAKTRFRLLERLSYVAVVILGTGLALSQFSGLDRLANGLLASSAITAAVIGFAARQLLANALAGLVIAISQPVRIGDRIEFEELVGVVEDIRLSYTVLVTEDDRRALIPNELITSSVVVRLHK